LNIGISGVDLFFVISGFVMVGITRGWFHQIGTVRKFIYHRVTRIYPVYWFYSLVMLAIFLVQQKAGGTRIVDITASFMLFPQDQLPLLVVGWSLIHEVYFYLVFSLLLIFPERRLLPLMALWGISSIIAWLILSPVKSPDVHPIANPLTLEFIAGGLIARIHFSATSTAYRGYVFLALAFVWWALGYAICMKLGLPLGQSAWLRVLLFGVPAAFAVYALVTIEKYAQWQLPSWLISIGDASFSIYLSHVLVIAMIGHIWEKIGIVGSWMNGSVLMVMFFSTLSIGLLSFQFIERPLLKFTRRFE
jgi:peptidoglycan/LPS O-acetylase OafA/YrhL